ncbi:hypothetical protein IQ26_07179 [Mesorhizobium tianshanense]|uniref:Uncharacterized protein n=1 Tax=Mesorhizobium tianshanense TaxID=39844 RepID=A0A562MGX5_9HYPH|nr:hypothetical protein IQ26_07179 [Mesorhizobium tianshanense]
MFHMMGSCPLSTEERAEQRIGDPRGHQKRLLGIDQAQLRFATCD